ncbi:MAG: HU family DNA-binding protein [Prevotellaceae bacterium]|jgi:DNA-binding protein HU-beta|nr:HU family DNA-binding protein [Prevotellaceae bacterium]
MNNKDFIATLSGKLDLTQGKTSELTTSFLSQLIGELEEDKSIHIPSFGTFEVKKKGERVSVNPATQARMLVPPKLSLSFKPSVTLKDKFK